MKRTLITLTFIVITIVNAFAENFYADGWQFAVTDATNHYVSIVSVPTGALTIPTTVENSDVIYTITGIGGRAFKNCTGLTSVTIPNTIKSIGSKAFTGCTGLTSIIIPSTVTGIGECIFENCNYIYVYCMAENKPSGWNSKWYYQDNITIGATVFWGTKLDGDLAYRVTDKEHNDAEIIGYFGNSNTINIPSEIFINAYTKCTVKGIGDYAFWRRNPNMTEIDIPNTVESIGEGAFGNCIKMQNINLPVSVTSIGDYAFKGCSGLQSINITDATIGRYAFYDCSGLKSVTIAGSITSISDYAFANCTNIETLTINCPNILEIYQHTFELVDKSVLVFVPCGNANSYKSVDYWSDFMTYIEGFVYDFNVTSSDLLKGSTEVIQQPSCDAPAVFKATANEDYAFKQWSDGNTDNPRTATITTDTTFIAIFTSDKAKLELKSANTVQGKVSESSGTYHYRESVTISASANYGYYFTGWSDNVTTNPRTITLIKDTTIQAQFAINQYEILVNCNETERGTVSGGGSFKYLTDNTILATANYGYEFVHWSDNNTDNPRTIHLICDTAFTAVFAPKVYELQVTSANEDLGTVAGSNSFEYKTVATISATAIAAHHHFVQWNDGNRQNPRQVTVERDTLFVATFGIDSFNIAATYNIAMGAVSGAGLYSYGSAAKVEAKPAAHHHFVQWTNGAAQTTQEFVVEHDTAFEAVFAIDRHTVALAVSDSLCGAVSGAGSYDYGASVQLQATPAANCYFTGWSDGVTTNPRTLTVEGDTTIVAEFGKLQTVNIMVAANDTLRGTVAGTGSYVVGSNATLSATASAHYLFEQWSDGRTDNPRTVRIIADATYTAVFVPMQYNIILSQNNADMGMVSGSGVYSYGERVSCLAKPYPNYHFVQWSNGETANPYEFVVEEDKMLTAYFAAGAVTGIEDDAAVAPVIYAVGKTIIVENATNEILVYDAMGKLLCRDVACRVRTEITVNGTGVYIVKTGNAVMRVVVE